MTDHSHSPVLIVGAGPTGLTAALELSRLGVDVRIVDRAVRASNTSRALGVQARTLELLRPRGVGADMMRLGNRAHRTALYADGRHLAGIDFTRMATEFNHILMLAQSETERLLAERLAEQGVDIERGIGFESLEQGGGDAVTVRVTGADGRRDTISASYVIAADGAHSAVRKCLGLPFDGRVLEQRYVLGDIELVGAMPEDQLSIFLAAKGFLAVFPMGDGRFRFMATDPDGITGQDGEPTLADIQKLYDRTVHLPAQLHHLNWSSRFRINSRHMTTLRAGRVLFGGDAAHVHSPAGGQGMNTGIQDMINLCWKLAMVLRGEARPELLDTYQTDRLPVIEDVVALTERATSAFNSTRPATHAALTRLVPIMLSRRIVANKAAPRLGQLAANYRGGPLARGGGRLGALKAGDRVPDTSFGDGRLYDVLDTARLTLIVIGAAASARDACDGYPAVGAVYEISPQDGPLVRPGWLLIRPDGYLAAAGRPSDTGRLRAWLRRWCVAGTAADSGRSVTTRSATG